MAYLDAVQDADAYWDARHREQEAQERAEEAMAGEFIAAVRKGDVTVSPPFAHQTSHWDKTADAWVHRPAMLWECMQDACDYDRPGFAEVMQLLTKAATGQDVQRAAADLVREMARTYARHHAEASND